MQYTGVIILPTQAMHFFFPEIPSKLPYIRIVWSPQNWPHLMTLGIIPYALPLIIMEVKNGSLQ